MPSTPPPPPPPHPRPIHKSGLERRSPDRPSDDEFIEATDMGPAGIRRSTFAVCIATALLVGLAVGLLLGFALDDGGKAANVVTLADRS